VGLLVFELNDVEGLWNLALGAAVKSTSTTTRPGSIGCLLAARPSALGADFSLSVANS
jgi:hypothetical protein